MKKIQCSDCEKIFNFLHLPIKHIVECPYCRCYYLNNGVKITGIETKLIIIEGEILPWVWSDIKD